MTQRRLPAKVKTAIVAERVAGASVQDICKKYGVHRNSVRRLVNEVRQAVPESALGPDDWRKELQEDVPRMSVHAIRRSLADEGEIHRAAITALAALRGLRILGGESATVNVYQLLANPPAGLDLDVPLEWLTIDTDPE